MVFIGHLSLCIWFFVSTCYGLKDSYFVLYKEGSSFKIANANEVNVTSDWLSEVAYKNDINNTGFAYIEINTNENHTDAEQAYYAGFLEGTVTSDLIYSQWNNVVKDFCKTYRTGCKKINEFVKENTKWVKHSVKTNKDDLYWQHVGLFYTQMRGILNGYNENTNFERLTWNDIVWLNFIADFGDLKDGLTGNQTIGDGHCSVLIKILPGNEDIYFGHNAWTSYQSMLRLQKKYILNFKASLSGGEHIPGSVTTFSGYPGSIASLDDFNLISSGLATTETTNQVFNRSLWNSLSAKNSVFESVRCVVANRLANSGETWYKIFEKYNSGTYNNQWMILDYKKFKPGKPPTEGAFFVVEQLPTLVVGKDLTNVLIENGYWSSYNIPYFNETYQLAGYPDEYKKFGNWFSHDEAPRARIFKRDHTKVKDMTSYMALMRSNDYTNDPYARCSCSPPYSAAGAIAARDDLNPINGTFQFNAQSHRPDGAIDAKITNSSLFLKLQFVAVSGPTTGTDEKLPVFVWSKSNFTETPHLLHPDVWNFKPVLHKWKLT